MDGTMSKADLDAKLAAQIAPKVTPEQIAAVIVERLFLRPTGTLTICVLTLANGFTVTGESACASPENYDQAIGEKIAFDQAVSQIWTLEGYALRDRLASNAVSQEAKLQTSLEALHRIADLGTCAASSMSVGDAFRQALDIAADAITRAEPIND